MCVKEGVTGGTTIQSCRCSHSAQRGQWDGRRKDGAQTAHCGPQTTQGSYSVSEGPPSVQPAVGWTCMSLNHSCRQGRRWCLYRKSLLWCIYLSYGAGQLSYLVRDRTPVTGELVEWLPLLTEPGSLLSGGLQYVVRFAPLLPPAIADTPTAHFSKLRVKFYDVSPYSWTCLHERSWSDTTDLLHLVHM